MLDCDVRGGFGPETMTIMGLSQASADVKHYVNNYTKEASFSISQAVAQLYGTSGLLEQIHVPTTGSSADIYWTTWVLHRKGGYKRVNALSSTVPGPA